ncbi:unnamed protein product [Adineta ricciae]|uniref:PiggyBac transposable element-derived protein domain-containing protein n=1 Tax=Adineta ricciae TaxID=249248 RepID=A0A815JTV1_ADIRI|nr:unnamed protein product [Adineta ricciae]
MRTIIAGTSRKRTREISPIDSSTDLDSIISKDDDSKSDRSFSPAETESDDTSTDELISNEDDSSPSTSNDGDDDETVHPTGQPESVEKGGIVWTTESKSVHGRLQKINILKKKPGEATSVETIIDAFKLFITDDILDEIVLQTNKYAKRHIDQVNQRRSNATSYRTTQIRWIDLDRVELEALIGLLIESGVRHSNHASTDELWDISRSVPVYHATMSMERFKYLMRFLRFDDRQRRDSADRRAPIRSIFQRFVKQLPRHFTPSENVTVDEQLVPFRGRCSFIQYMPKKPAKYGLKFWLLCDVNSRYVLALDLYTGKEGNVAQKNLATNVVLRLVDQLPANIKQDRNVTYDRYFTSLDVSQALLERKMSSLGVVDRKRRFVPNELKLTRDDLYSSWFYFCEQTTILSYQAKDKKPPVILLSTSHEFSEVFDDEKRLPCMIHDYNQTKVGVDLVDQCISNYSVRRITRRWPMMVFYNMVDIAAINAMTVWVSHNPEWNSRPTQTRHRFLSSLSQSLMTPHQKRRSESSSLSSKTKLALRSLGYELKQPTPLAQDCNGELIKTKKRCYLCPSHPGRKVRMDPHTALVQKKQNVVRGLIEHLPSMARLKSLTLIHCDVTDTNQLITFKCAISRYLLTLCFLRFVLRFPNETIFDRNDYLCWLNLADCAVDEETYDDGNSSRVVLYTIPYPLDCCRQVNNHTFARRSPVSQVDNQLCWTVDQDPLSIDHSVARLQYVRFLQWNYVIQSIDPHPSLWCVMLTRLRQVNFEFHEPNTPISHRRILLEQLRQCAPTLERLTLWWHDTLHLLDIDAPWPSIERFFVRLRYNEEDNPPASLVGRLASHKVFPRLRYLTFLGPRRFMLEPLTVMVKCILDWLDALLSSSSIFTVLHLNKGCFFHRTRPAITRSTFKTLLQQHARLGGEQGSPARVMIDSNEEIILWL